MPAAMEPVDGAEGREGPSRKGAARSIRRAFGAGRGQVPVVAAETGPGAEVEWDSPGDTRRRPVYLTWHEVSGSV
jgi:hypothetical protein